MRQFVQSVVVSCVAVFAGTLLCVAPLQAGSGSYPRSSGIQLNGPLGSLFGRARAAPVPQIQPQPVQKVPQAESPVAALPPKDDGYDIPEPLPRPPEIVLNPEPEIQHNDQAASPSDNPENVDQHTLPAQTPAEQKTPSAPPAPKTYPVKVKVASADDSVLTMPNISGFGMMSAELPQQVARAPLIDNSLFMPRIEVASLTPTLGPFGMPFFIKRERQQPAAVKTPQVEATSVPETTGSVAASAKQEPAAQIAPGRTDHAAQDKKHAAEKPPPLPQLAREDAAKTEELKDLLDKDLKPIKLEADDVPVALAAPSITVRHKRRFEMPQGASLSLGEAVGRSVMRHPEIGMAEARTRQARAGVRVATSNMLPQIDGRLTYGNGNDIGAALSGISDNQMAGAVTLRQLLFDFGASKRDRDRSNFLLESERYRVLDKVEDVSLRTAEAYVKVLEQRELLSLADEYVGAHEKLSQLVRLNQSSGNATIADVSRINSRLLEAHTILTTLEADLENATDELRRLVHETPGRLSPLPKLKGATPSSVDEALVMVDETHPRLLSLGATSASMTADVDAKKRQFLPKLTAEVQSDWVDSTGLSGSAESNVRGLFVVRHKIFDGLARNGILEEAQAKRTENMLLYQNERDNINADIRQAYRAIDSAKVKSDVLRQSVSTGQRVNDLYIEQFKGGKRTLFELLDAQAVLFSAKRDMIASQYEDVRARLILLRSLGRLAHTLAG